VAEVRFDASAHRQRRLAYVLVVVQMAYLFFRPVFHATRDLFRTGCPLKCGTSQYAQEKQRLKWHQPIE
jgi:hypothetical protein